VFPEAQGILAEFGNLRFGYRSDFVDLNPFLAEEGAEEILPFQQQIGKRLYGIGIMEHQDRIYLAVDEEGLVYTVLLDELKPFASSFDRTVEHLVRPTISRSDWEDDLRSIGMLGSVWTHPRKTTPGQDDQRPLN
jgi:hypothetical protein